MDKRRVIMAGEIPLEAWQRLAKRKSLRPRSNAERDRNYRRYQTSKRPSPGA